MSNATHEQLLQVVYAEWAVAILLTVSAGICFVRNRRASFLFLPWLGVACVAALHGTFFYRDGSGTREMLLSYGIVFGLFVGAPVGAIFMQVFRSINDRQTGMNPQLRAARPNWPQTTVAWINAGVGAVLLPTLLALIALIYGIPLRLREAWLDLVFWGIVGGVIGGRLGNWWCGRS